MFTNKGESLQQQQQQQKMYNKINSCKMKS